MKHLLASITICTVLFVMLCACDVTASDRSSKVPVYNPSTFSEFSNNCMDELYQAYQHLKGINSFCKETYPDTKNVADYLVCRTELKKKFHKENKISYMCKAVVGIKTDDPLLERILHEIFYQRPMHPDF